MTREKGVIYLNLRWDLLNKSVPFLRSPFCEVFHNGARHVGWESMSKGQ